VRPRRRARPGSICTAPIGAPPSPRRTAPQPAIPNDRQVAGHEAGHDVPGHHVGHAQERLAAAALGARAAGRAAS
jgi:hypothetical protein